MASSQLTLDADLRSNPLNEDPAFEYHRTYLEWRSSYGLGDECMDELHAAIMAECERAPLSDTQRARLQALAQRIRADQQAFSELAA